MGLRLPSSLPRNRQQVVTAAVAGFGTCVLLAGVWRKRRHLLKKVKTLLWDTDLAEDAVDDQEEVVEAATDRRQGKNKPAFDRDHEEDPLVIATPAAARQNQDHREKPETELAGASDTATSAVILHADEDALFDAGKPATSSSGTGCCGGAGSAAGGTSANDKASSSSGCCGGSASSSGGAASAASVTSTCCSSSKSESQHGFHDAPTSNSHTHSTTFQQEQKQALKQSQQKRRHHSHSEDVDLEDLGDKSKKFEFDIIKAFAEDEEEDESSLEDDSDAERRTSKKRQADELPTQSDRRNASGTDGNEGRESSQLQSTSGIGARSESMKTVQVNDDNTAEYKTEHYTPADMLRDMNTSPETVDENSTATASGSSPSAPEPPKHLKPPQALLPGNGQKVWMKTFGCSHNASDSEIMLGLLQAEGYVITDDQLAADVMIVNSCTVKNPSQDAAVNLIKKSKNEGGGSGGPTPVILTGCVSQADPKFVKNLEQSKVQNVSIVGLSYTDKIVDAVEQVLQGNRVYMMDFLDNPLKQAPLLPKSLMLPKVRKNPLVEIIAINTGCLGDCTYCKTKFARGTLKSYSVEQIVERAKFAWEKDDVQQIWLTSEDTGAYGLDIGTNIVHLLEALLKVAEEASALAGRTNAGSRSDSDSSHIINPKKKILRLGMTNPPYMARHATRIGELLNHENMFEFLHVPVQSGADHVLKNMNREYTKNVFTKMCKQILQKSPDMTFATDIICGFPDEKDSDHVETLNLIKDFQFAVVNISQFYPRPGTKAAHMQRVDTQVVKQRSTEVTDLFMSYTKNEKWKGKKLLVYWSDTDNSRGRKQTVGHTKQHVKVVVPRDDKLLNTCSYVLVKKVTKWHLEGEHCSGGEEAEADEQNCAAGIEGEVVIHSRDADLDATDAAKNTGDAAIVVAADEAEVKMNVQQESEPVAAAVVQDVTSDDENEKKAAEPHQELSTPDISAAKNLDEGLALAEDYGEEDEEETELQQESEYHHGHEPNKGEDHTHTDPRVSSSVASTPSTKFDVADDRDELQDVLPSSPELEMEVQEANQLESAQNEDTQSGYGFEEKHVVDELPEPESDELVDVVDTAGPHVQDHFIIPPATSTTVQMVSANPIAYSCGTAHSAYELLYGGDVAEGMEQENQDTIKPVSDATQNFESEDGETSNCGRRDEDKSHRGTSEFTSVHEHAADADENKVREEACSSATAASSCSASMSETEEETARNFCPDECAADAKSKRQDSDSCGEEDESTEAALKDKIDPAPIAPEANEDEVPQSEDKKGKTATATGKSAEKQKKKKTNKNASTTSGASGTGSAPPPLKSNRFRRKRVPKKPPGAGVVAGEEM
ncbi:unnamed protein product [Amoebophrya sp. A120]|nr:unnamed protein product [Amoebophrya sp. A120]|eukprot:GSA120T00006143001.1